ncbi:MAG TPA: GntR family transcriptional regulator [Kiloniellales bacterium]|nr:GntR family transcriptional regulator [Kiloniellales bacterium]
MPKKTSLSTPLTSESLASRAYERIEGAIVNGELEPGARISEADLARRFGISRGPLREAIARLEGKKLVRRTTNLGARVVALRAESLIELYYVREALEGMACRLACERLKTQSIAEIEQILERHAADAAVQSGVSYVQKKGDQDFHFKIARLSGNDTLITLLCEDLYSLIRLYRVRFSSMPGRPQKALEEHRAILAALKAGNPARAEEAMRAHIRASRENLAKGLSLMAEPPAPPAKRRVRAQSPA